MPKKGWKRRKKSLEFQADAELCKSKTKFANAGLTSTNRTQNVEFIPSTNSVKLETANQTEGR